MEVLHKERDLEGMFYIMENGEQVGEMTYLRQGDDRMIMIHTLVDDSLQGTGAGMKMLDSAVAFAKEQGLKMTALCTYVAHQFEKHPEKYTNVMA